MKKKRKSAKRPRKPKGKIFIQSYGTYSDQTLVIVGDVKKKALFKFLKKNDCRKSFIDWMEQDYEFYRETIASKNKGQFCVNEKCHGTLLMLRNYEDHWDFWETLIHELHHAVQHFCKRKCMQDEMEGPAYLQEFLFREIRNKIQHETK